MRVTASKKQLVAALVVALAAMLAIAGDLCWQLTRYSAAQAQVQAVTSVTERTGGSNSKLTLNHYVEVTYETGGTTHSARFHTKFPSRYHTGDLVRVRFHPDTPEKIRDPYWMKVELLILAVFALFILLDIKAIRMV